MTSRTKRRGRSTNLGHEPKRKRGPSHRRGLADAKAQSPGQDSLTLRKFKDALSETLHAWDGKSDYPAKDEALARRREAIEKGDLLALYTALEWCHLDRYGWPQVLTEYPGGPRVSDSSKRPPDASDPPAAMPRWLLAELSKLVWRGIHGDWPKRRARHSAAVGRYLDRRVDLARTYHVLKARAGGVPWETVFEDVAEQLKRSRGEDISPRALEYSYRKVAKEWREGRLSSYLFEPRFPVPQVKKP